MESLILDRTKGEAAFYLNGSLVAREKFRVGPKPLTTGLRISSDCAGPFKGVIDEVRIYDRILKYEEVQALYSLSPTIYILDVVYAKKWWTSDYDVMNIERTLARWMFRASTIYTLADFLNIIEDKTLKNLILINTHGEAVPIPDKYVAANNSPQWIVWLNKIKEAVEKRGFVWVNIAGYPFFHVTNDKYTSWRTEGLTGVYTIGELGLSLFLSDPTATAWSERHNNEFAVKTDSASIIEFNYAIQMPASLQNKRMIRSNLVPEFALYSSGQWLTVGGYKLGNGYFLTTILSEPVFAATMVWIYRYLYQNELVVAKSQFGRVLGSGWYPVNSIVNLKLAEVSTERGLVYYYVSPSVRYVFRGWVDAKSTNLSFQTSDLELRIGGTPVLLTAKWTPQYFVSLESRFGKVDGSGWYFDGEQARVSVLETTVYSRNGSVKYIFVGWNGDIQTQSQEISFLVKKPTKLIADWDIQYLVSVTFNPPEIAQTFPNIRDGFYSAGQKIRLNFPSKLNLSTSVKYVYKQSCIVFCTSETDLEILADRPIDILVYYQPFFRVEAFSPFGAVDGVGWYLKGSNVKIQQHPTEVGFLLRNVFVSWRDAEGNIVSTRPIVNLENLNEPIRLYAEWRTDASQLYILIAFGFLALIVMFLLVRLPRQKRTRTDDMLTQIKDMYLKGEISEEAYQMLIKELKKHK